MARRPEASDHWSPTAAEEEAAGAAILRGVLAGAPENPRLPHDPQSEEVRASAHRALAALDTIARLSEGDMGGDPRYPGWWHELQLAGEALAEHAGIVRMGLRSPRKRA